MSFSKAIFNGTVVESEDFLPNVEKPFWSYVCLHSIYEIIAYLYILC